MISLYGFWVSCRSLLTRFKIQQNRDAAFTKVKEEFNEVQAAHESRDKEAVLKEAIDLIVTLVNLLGSYGVTYPEFIQALYAVQKKNAAKTEENHEVTGNLVIRKAGYRYDENSERFVYEGID